MLSSTGFSAIIHVHGHAGTIRCMRIGTCKGRYAMASKVTTNSKVAPVTPVITTCTVCGKRITRTGSVNNGHGATCAALLASGASVQALRAKYTQPVQPLATISVANLHRFINAHVQAGCTVSKMVKCIGGDRVNKYLPAHAMCIPVYVNGQRFVSAWLGTVQGLQAMASATVIKQGSTVQAVQAMHAYNGKLFTGK
jgi:hypothetical protein